MAHKILFGSILSVVILILVSFTSVVGYNSVESDVKASPLFNIRSSRAIDEASEDLSCEYVGKGKPNNIALSKRNNKITLFQKAIDKISQMDDEAYGRVISLITNCINWHILTDINIEEIEIALYKLRTNQYNNTIPWVNWNNPQSPIWDNSPQLFLGGIFILLIFIVFCLGTVTMSLPWTFCYNCMYVTRYITCKGCLTILRCP